MGQNGSQPGQEAAVASLVLGILSVICWFFGSSTLLSILFGVLGLLLAGNAKRSGFDGSLRTAGFVLSLIGLIGGSLVFVACVACAGAFFALASFMPV